MPRTRKPIDQYYPHPVSESQNTRHRFFTFRRKLGLFGLVMYVLYLLNWRCSDSSVTYLESKTCLYANLIHEKLDSQNGFYKKYYFPIYKIFIYKYKKNIQPEISQIYGSITKRTPTIHKQIEERITPYYDPIIRVYNKNIRKHIDKIDKILKKTSDKLTSRFNYYKPLIERNFYKSLEKANQIRNKYINPTVYKGYQESSNYISLATSKSKKLINIQFNKPKGVFTRIKNYINEPTRNYVYSLYTKCSNNINLYLGKTIFSIQNWKNLLRKIEDHLQAQLEAAKNEEISEVSLIQKFKNLFGETSNMLTYKSVISNITQEYDSIVTSLEKQIFKISQQNKNLSETLDTYKQKINELNQLVQNKELVINDLNENMSVLNQKLTKLKKKEKSQKPKVSKKNKKHKSQKAEDDDEL